MSGPDLHIATEEEECPEADLARSARDAVEHDEQDTGAAEEAQEPCPRTENVIGVLRGFKTTKHPFGVVLAVLLHKDPAKRLDDGRHVHDPYGWNLPCLPPAIARHVLLCATSEHGPKGSKAFYTRIGEPINDPLTSILRMGAVLDHLIFHRKPGMKQYAGLLHAAIWPADETFRAMFKPRKKYRGVEIERNIYLMAQFVESLHRRWWQSPALHLHHWRVYIPFVAAVKRWAFSRCADCGKRFKWGSDCVGPRDSSPRWFRGEPEMRHPECFKAKFDPNGVSVEP